MLDINTYLIERIKGEQPKLSIIQIIQLGVQMSEWQSDDIFYCPDDILHAGLVRLYQSLIQMRKK